MTQPAKPVTTEELKNEEAALLKRHPVPHEIFLPSEKISPEDRLEGIRKVVDLYENRMEPHRERLREIRKQYLGRQRCFIIGNGPSINQTDLSKLKDEVTFGLNGIFLLYDKLGFRPTFYVVEDHLVAEDRAENINSLTGSVKIFPVHLRYCIEEGPDTVWIHAKTRTRSREGNYDFSTDASKNTFMGCTVTFTAIQLAFYFGFREIYLVGVDSNYDIPKDVAISRDYNVHTLDMKSDDPNHFHPDYFGKGFRWHDPQVDRMICAYEKARDISLQHGTVIFNATKGGKLESFPRVDYDSLFPAEKAGIETKYPRTLVVDLTAIGGESATGQLKATLFQGWEPGKIMQIFRDGHKHFVVHGEKRIQVNNMNEIAALIRKFGPEVVYSRPVDLVSEFFDPLEALICDLKLPSVMHIMDDWPERLRHTNLELFDDLIPQLSRMFRQSDARLSISDAMSRAFAARYGVDFTAIANGVDPREWPDVERKPRNRFLLRYSGGLAPDMGRDSVLAVARLVHELNTSGQLSLDFEIYTNKVWMQKEEQTFHGLKGVTMNLFVPREEYSQLLTQADALLLAYNFDIETIRYIRYSLANKLPDSLASGTPVIAFGPDEINTIATLREMGVGLVAGKIDEVREHLLSLATDEERKNRIGRAARCYVFQNYHVNKTKESFRSALQNAAESRKGFLVGPYFKEEQRHLDEAQLACMLFKPAQDAEILVSDRRASAEKVTEFKVHEVTTEKILAEVNGNSGSPLLLALDTWEGNEESLSQFTRSSDRPRTLILNQLPSLQRLDELACAGFQLFASESAQPSENDKVWSGLRPISPETAEGITGALAAIYPPMEESEIRATLYSTLEPSIMESAAPNSEALATQPGNTPSRPPLPKIPLPAALAVLALFIGGAFAAFHFTWGQSSTMPGVIGAILGLLFAVTAIAGYSLLREISILRQKIQHLSQLSDRRKAESAKQLAKQVESLRGAQERANTTLTDLRERVLAIGKPTKPASTRG